MDSRALQQALDLEFSADVSEFLYDLRATCGMERNFRFRALREISEALTIDELVRLAANLAGEPQLVEQPRMAAAANG